MDRGIPTISAASICSSWKRCRPASSSRPTVSRSNNNALSTRQLWTYRRSWGSSASYGLPVTGSTPLIRAWTSLIFAAAALASDFVPNVIVYVKTNVRCKRFHGFRS